MINLIINKNKQSNELSKKHKSAYFTPSCPTTASPSSTSSSISTPSHLPLFSIISRLIQMMMFLFQFTIYHINIHRSTCLAMIEDCTTLISTTSATSFFVCASLVFYQHLDKSAWSYSLSSFLSTFALLLFSQR